jgi:hypothetical protein
VPSAWAGPDSDTLASRPSWTGYGPPPLTRDQVALSLFQQAHLEDDEFTDTPS